MNLLLQFCSFLTLFLAASAAHAQTLGQVSISNESYLSPDYYSTNKKQFSFVEVSFRNLLGRKSSKDDGSLGVQTELTGQVAPGTTAMSYLNIKQLFWQQDAFTAGRRLHRWSDLDQRFNLGLFQPRFTFNELSAEQQGLSGLFLNLGEPGAFEFTFFGSHVFIPDQGANFEVKNGEFVETSPYFRMPPGQAVIMGQDRDVNYTLNKPDFNEVVNQPSFGAQVTIGEYRKGAFFQFATASKPSNQLSLGIEQYLSLAASNSIEVTITPKTYRHRVSAADLRYSFENIYASLGLALEAPEKPNFEPQHTYTQYGDSTAISPAIGLNIKRIRAEASYLRVDEKAPQVVGPYKSETRLLQRRFLYSSLYQLQGELLLLAQRNNRLELFSQYQVSEGAEFSIWTSRLKHRFAEDWSWWGQTQFIAVASLDRPISAGLDAFENNDSVRLGLSYVF